MKNVTGKILYSNNLYSANDKWLDFVEHAQLHAKFYERIIAKMYFYPFGKKSNKIILRVLVCTDVYKHK